MPELVGAQRTGCELAERWAAPRIRLLVVASLTLVVSLTGAAATYVWLERFLRITTPHVPGIDLYSALIDATPLTVTFQAGTQSVVSQVTADEVRHSIALWRRMTLGNWIGTIRSDVEETVLQPASNGNSR